MLLSFILVAGLTSGLQAPTERGSDHARPRARRGRVDASDD